MRDLPTSSRVIDLKRKRRNYRIRIFVLFFLLFVSIVYGVSYFSFHPNLNINEIQVNGTEIINLDEVKESSKELIFGKYFKLFSKSNYLIYPKEKLYNSLIKKYPRIESLSISQKGRKTLVIDIKERSGSYLYCGSAIPEDKSDLGEDCYFINNDGYVFDEAPYFSGNVYFKYFNSIPEIADSSESVLGKSIMDKDHFHLLTLFIEGVSNLGFKPIHVYLDTSGVGSLYLSTSGSDYPKIIFNNDDHLGISLDNLKLSMSKNEFRNDILNNYEKLSYLDLRFNNKVIYKFKDE